MRVLADENFPGPAVAMLRSQGHDVLWVRTHAPGLSDEDVLALAAETEPIVLTFDKDFGDVARGTSMPAACGVILFQMRLPKYSESGAVIAARLAGRDDWRGKFSVVEAARVRMRPLRIV